MALQYDTIIVGAGHNGLVTAAYLARAGQRVLVLERRDILGGCCVTEELWPGFKVSTAAYVNSLLRPEIIRDLDLRRPIYQATAAYGHFGRDEEDFTWEHTDKAQALRESAMLVGAGKMSR